MKKTIVIAVGLIVLLAACDRKAFVKKIVGTWKFDRYIFDGLEQTVFFDTTFREWQLTITDVNQTYTRSWYQYAFAADSLILVDTLGYDTPNMVYIINYDTLRFIDTTKTPYMETGVWDLINSEEDLQLRSDSNNAVEIHRILELSKNNLTLRKGNEELYLGK